MKKRYLNTIEEVLTLKDTDTKIYRDLPDFKDKEKVNYYKFVNGFLCWFEDEENAWTINAELYHNDKFYILEEGEEPIQEATEADIGKLCYFWDDDMPSFRIGKLDGIDKIEKNDEVRNLYKTETNNPYQHCRRLTTSEIAILI